MSKGMIIEKVKDVWSLVKEKKIWADISENPDVFWIGASVGVVIGALI